MQIHEFITLKGILCILEECAYNLKNVKQCIKRECKLPNGTDLTYTMKKFKKIIMSMQKRNVKDTLLEEINKKMKNYRKDV